MMNETQSKYNLDMQHKGYAVIIMAAQTAA